MTPTARIFFPGILFGCLYVSGCADTQQTLAIRSTNYDYSQEPFAKESLNRDQSDDEGFDETQFAKREIIYTANVSLSVDDFDTFPQRLADSVAKSGGFIAEADIARLQGSRRTGRWAIRVPGTKYASFVQSLSGLGITESLNEKAADVTDKFVDLEARIKSGRQLEERILKLLEDKGERLENLLTVERELARVRTELEQKEGQLRFLQSQIAFSTIVLTASEKVTFQPELVKSFSERISAEWGASLVAARTHFENGLIWFAANGITLVSWLIGLYFAWLIVLRRLWKSLVAEYAPRDSSDRPLDDPIGS